MGANAREKSEATLLLKLPLSHRNGMLLGSPAPAAGTARGSEGGRRSALCLDSLPLASSHVGMQVDVFGVCLGALLNLAFS